eukprot:scaffold7381_cov310-Pinguiococcus_pyrenoidosus.AAC.29
MNGYHCARTRHLCFVITWIWHAAAACESGLAAACESGLAAASFGSILARPFNRGNGGGENLVVVQEDLRAQVLCHLAKAEACSLLHFWRVILHGPQHQGQEKANLCAQVLLAAFAHDRKDADACFPLRRSRRGRILVPQALEHYGHHRVEEIGLRHLQSNHVQKRLGHPLRCRPVVVLVVLVVLSFDGRSLEDVPRNAAVTRCNEPRDHLQDLRDEAPPAEKLRLKVRQRIQHVGGRVARLDLQSLVRAHHVEKERQKHAKLVVDQREGRRYELAKHVKDVAHDILFPLHQALARNVEQGRHHVDELHSHVGLPVCCIHVGVFRNVRKESRNGAHRRGAHAVVAVGKRRGEHLAQSRVVRKQVLSDHRCKLQEQDVRDLSLLRIPR